MKTRVILLLPAVTLPVVILLEIEPPAPARPRDGLRGARRRGSGRCGRTRIRPQPRSHRRTAGPQTFAPDRRPCRCIAAVRDKAAFPLAAATRATGRRTRHPSASAREYE